MKILIVVTSISMYESGKLETGLWLSELTHMYHLAKEQGYEIIIAKKIKLRTTKNLCYCW
jgi:hypothetical protein